LKGVNIIDCDMSSRPKGEISQNTDILEDPSHTFGMTNL